ncbi:MAG TPA: phosphatidate cytidylyltransferase [Solirubrobacterales bacterium]|nr:phosphatidate cytidylyltransferase [Solirubrobacterales bacterium]
MDFPPRPGSPQPRRESPAEQSPFGLEPGEEPEASGNADESEPGHGDAPEAGQEPPAGPRRRGGARASGRRSETAARILWAVPWIVFAVFIVAMGGPVFAVAMVGFAWAAQVELFRMTARSQPFEAAAFLGALGLVAAAYFGSSLQILLALVATVPVMLIFALLRPNLKNVTWSLAITMLALVWVALPFAHAVLLRELPLHGGALLVDVLVATFFTDTFAYLGGRMFGRRPLAPVVSPNKTIEGLLIGVLGGVLGFWLAGLYQDWLTTPEALLFGLCIALLAPLGDLFESAVKRDLDVKDTGRLLGPHGGILDRLDAVLFTIVAGYYLALAIVY